MFQCLKVLAVYVPKYHWGTEPVNILLQLSKGKRGSVISGVLERECIEFMKERSSRDPHAKLAA